MSAEAWARVCTIIGRDLDLRDATLIFIGGMAGEEKARARLREALAQAPEDLRSELRAAIAEVPLPTPTGDEPGAWAWREGEHAPPAAPPQARDTGALVLFGDDDEGSEEVRTGAPS